MTATTKTAKSQKPATTKAAKAAKPQANGQAKPRARKEGLRLPQVRILRVLAAAKAPYTRPDLVEAISQGDKPTAIGDALGVLGDSRAAREAAAGYPSLLTLEFVAMKEAKLRLGGNDDGRVSKVYSITPAGRKALAAAEKAIKEREAAKAK